MHGLPSGEIPVVPHVGWSNLYLEELLPKLSIPKAPGENIADDGPHAGAVGGGGGVVVVRGVVRRQVKFESPIKSKPRILIFRR